ncbi:MAG: HlyD family efflux transporter periplasmic adaptor subunit [Gammaproteobacteria bacterium]|nr:HlyD family efflux transporter periplasmic adaptor subunit [Gammaproteobacteria bacterium]
MAASETSALFRAEALKASRRRLWGDLLLTRPPGTGAWLVLLLLFLIAAAVLLWSGEFTRTERVRGYLVPDGGVLVVEAPQSGMVHALQVAEGDRVVAGQALLEIRDPRGAVAGGSGAEYALAALQAERDRLKATRNTELERFELERTGLEAALLRIEARADGLDARERILRAESALLERRQLALLRLGERGHVAKQQLDRAQQEGLQLESRGEQLRSARLELLEERAGIDERLRALPGLEALRFSELDDRASRLEREQAEISLQWRFELRAPMTGRVAALGVETGDSVRPGRTLMTLLEPDAGMQAILLVPSRAAGFIEPGQSVRLRYAAFPHARFGSHPGVVTSVSHSILSPLQVAPPGQADEPVYKVRVRPEAGGVPAYGRTLPLQAGMALEADVALERRRLIHWLFDPLLALRGRL